MSTRERCRSFGACGTTASEKSPTAIPASTSSQKWFAVATTQNQTHAG